MENRIRGEGAGIVYQEQKGLRSNFNNVSYAADIISIIAPPPPQKERQKL